MSPFPNKLVAVISKNIDSGVAMNTLAHLSLGMGATLGSEQIHLMDYVDQDKNICPFISKMPFIILQANSSKIRQLIQSAKEKNISWNAFTQTMTVGSWEDQAKRTQEIQVENLEFYGVVLFGDWATVSELTRKFSLWK